MSTNSAKGSAVSTAIGILIAGALLFGGLYGAYTNWFQQYLQLLSSQKWEPTPCTVTAMEIVETTLKGNTRLFTPSVTFSYFQNDKEYSSSRFWFGAKGTTDSNTARNAAGAFKADGQYECFVAPSDPREAVLIRTRNPEQGSATLYSLIAVGIGAIMGFGHFAGLLIRYFGGPTASQSNLQRAMVNGNCPIESGEPDEPLVIQAAESRVGVAIGLWIAGICWTGIISLIFMAVVQNRNWFPMIIIAVFFLVGIALLVFALYSTLQIFNPRPILACSQRDLYPGSEFELSWMFHGNAGKIQHLEIVLEGIEKVSYRQGTSTRTEEKPFFRKKIIDSDSPDSIAQGFELVAIPISTMHSFKSSNNAFTWQIRVLGKIAFWPDIRDRFEIVILAPKPDM